MKSSRAATRPQGFVLVLTLVLLALLVLAVYALSALVRVDGLVANASLYQLQARQNALLGLRSGYAELQRLAGPDGRVTGMAGITRIAPAAENRTRHWCGVWRQSDGGLLGWLASGAQNSAPLVQTGSAEIVLIGEGTVGAAAADSEPVMVGKIPVRLSETPAAAGQIATIGAYAWLVSDEGVKTPAYAPGVVPVIAPVIFANSISSAQGRLRDALASYAAALPKVLSYEQLALLPAPGAALQPAVLQDNFHSVTLTSRFLTAGGLQSGFININTNSVDLWRNVLATYQNTPGAVPFATNSVLSTRGTSLQNRIAAYAGAGKAAQGPFTTVDAVEGLLDEVFPANASPSAAQVMAVIRPMLAVRSDTFRIRGYGEALNPSDSTRPASVAQCEAVVQRTADPATGGAGWRFDVVYFRWLGPDDL